MRLPHIFGRCGLPDPTRAPAALALLTGRLPACSPSRARSLSRALTFGSAPAPSSFMPSSPFSGWRPASMGLTPDVPGVHSAPAFSNSPITQQTHRRCRHQRCKVAERNRTVPHRTERSDSRVGVGAFGQRTLPLRPGSNTPHCRGVAPSRFAIHVCPRQSTLAHLDITRPAACMSAVLLRPSLASGSAPLSASAAIARRSWPCRLKRRPPLFDRA
jgi:hypothetical protein